jgi:hypothetical protein
MRRLEAGSSGGGGADNSANPLELLAKTGNGCGGRATGATRAQRARRSKPRFSRVPGRHSLVAGAGVPARTEWWVKIVTPPGWPWSKPQTPRAERRGFGGVASTLPRLASESRGFEARGSGSLHADNGPRRSARPSWAHVGLARYAQTKERVTARQTTTPPRR